VISFSFLVSLFLDYWDSSIKKGWLHSWMEAAKGHPEEGRFRKSGIDPATTATTFQQKEVSSLVRLSNHWSLHLFRRKETFSPSPSICGDDGHRKNTQDPRGTIERAESHARLQLLQLLFLPARKENHSSERKISWKER